MKTTVPKDAALPLVLDQFLAQVNVGTIIMIHTIHIHPLPMRLESD